MTFTSSPDNVFNNRVQLLNPTYFEAGTMLNDPNIQYELITDKLWVSIRPLTNNSSLNNEYVLSNHAKGKKVQIIKGYFREDISSLSKFIHGLRIFNVDSVNRVEDNKKSYFEAICLENSIPSNYISDGTYFITNDQYYNPFVYQ